MDKKVYIAPEMEVEVLETEALMLAASNREYDTEDPNFTPRGAERRGTWGNFWN